MRSRGWVLGKGKRARGAGFSTFQRFYGAFVDLWITLLTEPRKYRCISAAAPPQRFIAGTRVRKIAIRINGMAKFSFKPPENILRPKAVPHLCTTRAAERGRSLPQGVMRAHRCCAGRSHQGLHGFCG